MHRKSMELMQTKIDKFTSNSPQKELNQCKPDATAQGYDLLHTNLHDNALKKEENSDLKKKKKQYNQREKKTC